MSQIKFSWDKNDNVWIKTAIEYNGIHGRFRHYRTTITEVEDREIQMI